MKSTCPFKILNVDRGRYTEYPAFDCDLRYHGMGYGACVGEDKCPIMKK